MSERDERRAHAMPFGAEIDPAGGVRFRLWGPDAARVEVRLEDGPGAGQTVAMRPRADGFHVAEVEEAGPGTHYRYRIGGERLVPDPASRRQARDVHGASVVEDPRAFRWPDRSWTGRPWEEAVVYELHVGTFSPAGTFAGVASHLDHLAAIGVTAIELMPIADFPGRRNWGYDGVLPFAPAGAYGTPDALKALVAACHARGLMILLDVVYNHFGPEGNYLHSYARRFFHPHHRTPWGEALNFDADGSRTVRDFFLHNALYWIEELGFDGLRIDAVHAIRDEGHPPFLEELSRAVREGPGRRRHVHLVVENHANTATLLGEGGYDAQWEEDMHHALHGLLTGESGGYYADYADDPVRHLGRALAEGFAWQGEPSGYHDGRARGEPSAALPPQRFVAFLQNHDQIGNRALGDRLAATVPERRLRAAATLLFLAPRIPMLFMGEEFGCRRPFPFFCDFGDDLAGAVREGRLREFERFPEFRDPASRARIPDPAAEATFRSAVLEWGALENDDARRWIAFCREALAARAREIVPRLGDVGPRAGRWRRLGERALEVAWRLGDGATLTLVANLGEEPQPRPGTPPGRLLFESVPDAGPTAGRPLVAGWSAACFLERP